MTREGTRQKLHDYLLREREVPECDVEETIPTGADAKFQTQTVTNHIRPIEDES